MSTRRIPVRHGLFLAMVAALLVSPLAGCTSGTGSAGSPGGSGSSDTSTSSSTQAPSGTTSPPPATSTSSGSPTAAAGQRCLASALRPGIGSADGAAGSTIFEVGLTNTGKVSCTLRGFPGVSLVGHGNGTQIGAAALRDTAATPILVTVAPGASTRFILRVTQAGNYPTADCSPVDADGLRIYPPGSTEAVFLADTKLTGCAKTSVTLLTVRPVGVIAG
jgi:hypothetical protein